VVVVASTLIIWGGGYVSKAIKGGDIGFVRLFVTGTIEIDTLENLILELSSDRETFYSFTWMRQRIQKYLLTYLIVKVLGNWSHASIFVL
jgi:hypothetical protein